MMFHFWRDVTLFPIPGQKEPYAETTFPVHQQKQHFRYELAALEAKALRTRFDVYPLQLYNVFPDGEFYELLHWFGFHKIDTSGTIKMAHKTTKSSYWVLI